MVPILMYHSLDSSGSVVSTPPEIFRRQMQHLHDASFRVMSLREVAERLRDGQPFPARAVAVTFDDGYRNLYEVAYPILRKYGFPATVFLVADYCGRNNQWPGHSQKIPVLDLLRWNEIREMARNGIGFGAHTLRHPNLAQVSWETGRDEIVRSKHEIERQIGAQASFFAWPYGQKNPLLQSLVQEYFVGALTTEMQFVEAGCSPYSLPRIDACYFTDNKRFFQLGAPTFERYVRWRRRLRSIRRRFLADEAMFACHA